MNNSINITYANYWKTSLLDADSGKGAFKDEKSLFSDFKKCTLDELEAGQINNKLVTELFSEEPDSIQILSIILRPKIYVAKFFHTKASQGTVPAFVTPIIVNANIDRDGRLYPTQTFIARDLLEPLDRGSFFVGNIADLDTFLTKNNFSDFYGQYETAADREETKDEWFKSRWRGFTEYYQKLFSEVTVEQTLTLEFELAEYFFL